MSNGNRNAVAVFVKYITGLKGLLFIHSIPRQPGFPGLYHSPAGHFVHAYYNQ